MLWSSRGASSTRSGYAAPEVVEHELEHAVRPGRPKRLSEERRLALVERRSRHLDRRRRSDLAGRRPEARARARRAATCAGTRAGEIDDRRARPPRRRPRDRAVDELEPRSGEPRRDIGRRRRRDGVEIGDERLRAGRRLRPRAIAPRRRAPRPAARPRARCQRRRRRLRATEGARALLQAARCARCVRHGRDDP